MPQTLCEYDVSVEPGFICLVDLDTGMTLTNAADAVIQQLAHQGYDLAHNRILYQDTMGNWDELVVRQGRFVGFAPLQAKTQAQAILNATRSGCPTPEDVTAQFFAE